MKSFLGILVVSFFASSLAQAGIGLPDSYSVRVWDKGSESWCDQEPGPGIAEVGTLVVSIQNAADLSPGWFAGGHSYSLKASVEVTYGGQVARFKETYAYVTWPGHGSYRFVFSPTVPKDSADVAYDAVAGGKSPADFEISGGDAYTEVIFRMTDGTVRRLCTERRTN